METARLRTGLLAITVVVVALGSAALANITLYSAGMQNLKQQLRAAVRSQTHLVSAVGRYDLQQFSELGLPASAAREATLNQLLTALRGFEGYGTTGEFVVAMRSGELIEFLSAQRHADDAPPASIPMSSALAEPMRRVLRGESGVMIGLDYEGAQVLAAFEPVPDLDLGLVAKVDMAEVRQPYLLYGAISLGASLLLALLAVWLILARSPLARRLLETERLANALSKSEGRMTTLLGNLPGMAYRCLNNRQWTMQYVSDGCVAITGHRPEALVEGNEIAYGDLIHPDDRALVWEQVQQAVEIGRRYEMEYRLVTADGRERWVWERGVAVQRTAGNDLQLEGFISDVTARRLAEAERRASEERYRQVFDNNPIGMYHTTPDGRVLLANPAMIRMLGCESFEQLSERNLEDDEHYAAGYSRAQFKAELERSGTVEGLESAWTKRDGSILHVRENARLVRDETGKTVYYEGTAEDITQRKLAETALAERERMLSEMSRIAKIGAWQFDPATGVGTWTEETARIHDTEPDSPTNVELGLSFFEGEARRKTETAIQQAIEQGQLYDLELPLVTAKQRRKWIRTIGHPVMEDGRCVLLRGTIQDISARKHSEQALRASEERYRRLAESTRAIPWEVEAESFAYVGGYVEELLGYPRESWLEPGAFAARLHPEDRDRVLAEARQASQLGEDYANEFRMIAADGREVWLHNEATLAKDPEKPSRAFGYAYDITDRKCIQQELENEVMRRRILVEQSRDGIVVIDGSGKVVEANRRYAAMLGYSIEEVHELHAWDWDDALPREAIQEMLDAVDESGDHFETRHRRKDGTSFDVEISTNGVRIAGRKLIFCVCRDITERKESQRAIQESEERYRLLAENATDVIWVADLDGRQTYVSPSIERILGYSVEEAMSHHIWSSLEPESAELAKRMLSEELARDGKPGADPNRSRVVEIIEKRKDGTAMHTETRASLIRDGEGRPIAIMGVNRDITERKKAEAELQRSHRELSDAHQQLKLHQQQLIQSEKLASLGQLAAGVAHEINNPIAFIKSNLGTLQDYMRVLTELLEANRELAACAETGDDRGLAAARERILKLEEQDDISFLLRDIDDLVKESIGGTKRVRDIVQDLRSFAHTGKANTEEADINRIIESSLRIAWNELKYRCEVEKSLAELPSLRCYPERLSQVFVNILVNAAQSIEDHGRVSVKTEAQDEQIVVRIADTGPGIPPEVIPRLFDPFFTTKEVGQGTGLGLAISQSTVQNHGGTIEVESELGVGTTLIVKLPLKGVEDG